MNTKFTKGPWQRDKYGSVKDANGESVMLHGFSLCCGYTPKDDPSHANTDVALAAPELYEALAMLAEYPLEAFGKENSKPDTPLFGANGWTLTVGDVLNARAVLKKARGEA